MPATVATTAVTRRTATYGADTKAGLPSGIPAAGRHRLGRFSLVTSEWHLGPVAVPVHGLFVALGVLAALLIFVYEARRRGALGEQAVVAASGALIGGAV